MLLRLQEETVLTNQVHAEELAYLQKTIMNLRARLADTASHQVHGSVSKWNSHGDRDVRNHHTPFQLNRVWRVVI